MKRPSSIEWQKALDPKLGIKSSLPKSKATLALVILLWMSSEDKYVIEYSKSKDKAIQISDKCVENLFSFLDKNLVITISKREDVLNKINENQLFQSQLEALIVAFELVWKIAVIKFRDSGKADSAERTGGIRYNKNLYYTNNIDLFELLVKSNKGYCNVLYQWLMEEPVTEDVELEEQLIKLVNYLSETAIFKLNDNGTDVIFDMSSVYDSLDSNSDEVDINGDAEAKGALRIIKGTLGEGLNHFLAYKKGIVSLKNEIDFEEFQQYRMRVKEFHHLANIDLGEKPLIENSVEEKIASVGDKKWNRIIFGAPGTGKSHTLEEDSNLFGDNMERVTFHPNYSYANFVGTYKPVMAKNELDWLIDDDKKKVISVLQDKLITAQEKYDLLYDKFKDKDLTRLPLLLGIYTDESFKTKKIDGTDAVGDNSVERNHGKAIRPYLNLQPQNRNNEISYEYVPGPFMRIYTQAINHPEEDFLLLIEEINRANVAAVFGDVFQLLDRKNGISEYPIATSEDIKKFLMDNLECLKGKSMNELSDEEKEMYLEMRIPNNMYIWATMNSADQGVFPIDTAFKRRWEFEYIGIDKEREKVMNYVIPIGMGDNRHYIRWNDLREGINSVLSKDENRVNEDKLLGPFFISKSVLDTMSNSLGDTKAEEIFIKAFESKVIMYLFEDVMKMRPEKIFVGCKDNKLFSKICEAFETDGEKIFGLNDIKAVQIDSISDDTQE